MRRRRRDGVTQMVAGVQREPTSATRLVLLVTAALFINFIDRGNLATAAPLLQDELHLSASQLGFLLSAFYYGYALCMAPAGWLAERYGAHKVLAAGLIIWSLSTLGTGLVHGFTALLVLRILLGVGESVSFPCASKVFANAIPVERLGVANGVLGFGYLVGPAVGTLLGGYLMSVYGWRPVFILFGALSLLWLWPWRKVKVALSPKGGIVDKDAPPFRIILRQRALWGASLGHFASNYSFYFILSWLPFYLVKERGFSMGTMALIASWAYLLNALSALFMGWVADRWIRGGRSADSVYKGLMAVTHVSGIACMAGMVMLLFAGVDCGAIHFSGHRGVFVSRRVRDPADHCRAQGCRNLGRRPECRRQRRRTDCAGDHRNSRRPDGSLRYRICARCCGQHPWLDWLGGHPAEGRADRLVAGRWCVA